MSNKNNHHHHQPNLTTSKKYIKQEEDELLSTTRKLSSSSPTTTESLSPSPPLKASSSSSLGSSLNYDKIDNNSNNISNNINKRNGPYSSLEVIRDIAESLHNTNNSQPQQQQPQQPYDQRQSYNNNNNTGFNNNNNNGYNRQQQEYDDNYENDESRFKPSSRWRKGERQGVNFQSNNNNQQQQYSNYNNREGDYLTEKPNNMIPSSPNKGQQSNNNNNRSSYQQQQQQNNYNNNPYSNNSYDDSPTLMRQQPQYDAQQRPSYYSNTPNHQQAIPNVHDYFNPPYPNNTQHAYPPTFSPQIIPHQPTFVHYPSYQSHPLSSPVIHHHINPPQSSFPPQQSQQFQFNQIQFKIINYNATSSISPPPSSYSNSQTPSQVTTPRGRANSDIINEQVPISKPRPQKLTIPIEEGPIIQEEENPKSIAWSTNMASPAKKKKGVTSKKDPTKKTPLKKQSNTRHSSVPPKFGIPYNLNRIESKIKDQIQMDKKTNPHKGNFEPVLVTSKNEETAIRDEPVLNSSEIIDASNISKIDSPVKSKPPPIPKDKPNVHEDEETPQQDNVSNFIVSKPPPRLTRQSSTPIPKQQEISLPPQNPPPVKPQSIVRNQTNPSNMGGYVPQYSNRASTQQNIISKPTQPIDKVPERITEREKVPERPRPIITPIPTEKLNQERERIPERPKPIMEVSRSDPIRQSQQQTMSYSQQFQQAQLKTPVRNVPSKRLEELLYQKAKPIESPRVEKGSSVLSIVENFMLDPNMKEFY
ncbi:predicted protein [Naegleria gruberi]|uniref:Predicted protein n=1 Tax=Naegleria gruberi TaxID=5762 RepID=D2VUS0_NAEGR|nr:uncharacterized protein NAEGRDRAFT_72762 [Naegleria gruberi]EFC39554.1 predicted protein [Naegleria gruberi]|eukprot:XP_002672298.1 predicted protein [Naegleria gruberi strain NEG-M]